MTDKKITKKEEKIEEQSTLKELENEYIKYRNKFVEANKLVSKLEGVLEYIELQIRELQKDDEDNK